ncbi:putative nucleotidyltransferase substrate binding domain-containing protein [Actibacterium ureilyticum]|uniref:putative nucleotidyltransferase substrate binding domain-containing protein n=1 Tax=Actibacterium ureilyticum TaxID=1590614 RepID=UPI003CCC2DC8
MSDPAPIADFLSHVHPYDSLPPAELTRVATAFIRKPMRAGDRIYSFGEPLDGLYVVQEGAVEVSDQSGNVVSLLGPRNSFGERGLSRDGYAATTADAKQDGAVLVLPPDEFRFMLDEHPSFRRFFDRSRPAETKRSDLATSRVSALMARDPITCPPGARVLDAAQLMKSHNVSCLGVTEQDRLVGIITTSDMVNRVLAAGLSGDVPVRQVMTPDPITLAPGALGTDILHVMIERRIGHLPVVEDGRMIGVVTQTDLTHFQALSSATLVQDIATALDARELADITARIPQLLVNLVASGNRHEVVTRLITDIGDACTRRLLALAEAKLGPPPVPYLWLACGSQGRQEQTGVSDQDNCLFLSDDMRPEHDAYFAALAKFVSDGLDVCGYFYCPGDMMATADRWRQPVRVWRDYFKTWVDKPDPMAQMLASVMFDLRPIGGDESLFSGLQAETLEMASKNSIFVAHMASNALKHTPPLGLLRGIATIRSGEHKNQLDMKHNGVVPVVDLGRIYALQGQITAANTRARLEAAEKAGVVSASGARDLLDAYDLIAQMRLEHQAGLVKAGKAPDNYLSPSALSDFERSHLRDAFVVVRTMQSAIGHGRAAPA